METRHWYNDCVNEGDSDVHVLVNNSDDVNCQLCIQEMYAAGVL